MTTENLSDLATEAMVASLTPTPTDNKTVAAAPATEQLSEGERIRRLTSIGGEF